MPRLTQIRLRGPYSEEDRLLFPDSIRILELAPAASEPSELSGRLRSYRLSDESLEYEALSYVWGDIAEPARFDCDGVALYITKNLENALRQLRLSDRPRYLWIDAVCINQNSTLERGHQVRLMRNIYKRAKTVLIWIGKEETIRQLPGTQVTDAQDAFEIIHRIVNHKRIAYAKIDYRPWGKTAEEKEVLREISEKRHAKRTAGPQYEPSWFVLERLFSSPWFWRLWVVQEVVVASSAMVIWGSQSIRWDLVGEAANWLKANYFPSRRHHIFGAYNAAHMFNLSMRAKQGRLHPFFTVMVSTWLFQSSDPRDRVFALLGLPNSDSDPDNDQLFLEPDYSLDESQVYLALARKVIAAEESIRLLNAVQHRPDSPLNSPSWVPQWHPRTVETLIPFDYVNNKMCEYFEDASSVLTSDPHALFLRGFQIGTITSMTEVISVDSLDSSFVHTTHTCNWIAKTAALLGEQKLDLTHSRLRSLCWTLTVGRGHDVWSSFDDHWHNFQAFWSRVPASSTEALSSATQPAEPEMELSNCDIHNFLGSATYGRRLFITSEGRVGLGPPGLQQGDVVTAFLGGYTPFVLRRRDDHYLLVGECYFHGHMDGEAAEQYREGEREAEMFLIR